MKTISEIISALRKSKNMTQEALANTIGVSAQTVSKWETGTSMPDILLLPMIADIFDVSVDALFDRESSAQHVGCSFEDLPEVCFDAVLSEMQRSWSSNADAETIKRSLTDDPRMKTLAMAENAGAVYADRELALVVRHHGSQYMPLLQDAKIAALLALLAEDDVRCVLLFVLQDAQKTFSVKMAAQILQMEEARVLAAVKKIAEINLITMHMIEIGEDEPVTIFQLYGGHKMLLVYAMFWLAKQLSDYQECYHGLRGNPTWGC